MGGFAERQRLGFGHFITRADLETNPRHISSLLSMVPGVQVTPATGLTGGGAPQHEGWLPARSSA